MSSTRRARKYYGASDATIWPADHPKLVKPHAKKDTKRWCKGKVGREHQTEIVRRWAWRCHPGPSWYAQVTGRNWACNHALSCSVCGKILAHAWDKDGFVCPDYVD